MTDAGKGGLALILSNVALLIVMALHPTGGQLAKAAGRFEAMAMLNTSVHTLAILILPLFFLGAIALTRKLAAPDRLAESALVVFGFALAAGMCAAILSGYVAPDVLRRIARAATPAAEEAWRALFRYTGMLNQAFARVLVIGSAVAILLWSVAMPRERLLRWYGILSSAAIILLAASGGLTLDIHGYGAVVLVQGLWFVVVGWKMLSGRHSSAESPLLM